MMIPNLNTVWRYMGPGNGHGDVQRVIASDAEEVVTVSYHPDGRMIEWSWLGPTLSFPKLFKFVGPPS